MALLRGRYRIRCPLFQLQHWVGRRCNFLGFLRFQACGSAAAPAAGRCRCDFQQGHALTVSSVLEEKAHNARLGGGTRERGFVGHMDNLKLPHPHRIAEALPGNMRSALATQLLLRAGHGRVANLHGGLRRWVDGGYRFEAAIALRFRLCQPAPCPPARSHRRSRSSTTAAAPSA
jgi:hypothetical protein